MEEIKANNSNAPQFEQVSRMSTAEVYRFGAQHHDMPAIESIKLKDGTTGEVLWLPKGISEHPEVRFAWLSPRSRELQRTPSGVLPTDQFAQETVLTVQRNVETGQYGATITLQGMVKGATAVAAAEAAWL